MKAISRLNKKSLISGAIAIIAICLSIGNLKAAGLLVADGGFGGQLEIKSQDVDVLINNGIAVTTVTQEFKNLENRQVEALYSFPVPKDASVSNFSMWINGKEMIGEVVEKKRAKKIYNSYKAKKRDPGLLEQKNYKTFEMRIFPIAPHAIQKVQITYYQELETSNNWASYIYPLRSETTKYSSTTTQGRFSFNLQVKSEIPIVEMESSSHQDQLAIHSHTKNFYQASIETKKGNLNKDIVISYKLKRPTSGVDFVFSKNQNEDGYFLMTITAGPELKKLNPGMDFVFILDISGSMANDGKMTISRNSIKEFINTLSPKDKFEILTFNISTTPLFKRLVSANEKNIEEGMSFLKEQSSKGSTDLPPAISKAYKYSNPDRQLNVIVLSDGMTDPGTDRDLINLIKSKPSNARVFCIGVGNEVNKPLLRNIAEESGGLSSFISKESNFKRQAKLFREKLIHPAISSISINLGNDIYDVEPKMIPNLYYGTPVRIYGRYTKPEIKELKLSGEIQGKSYSTTTSIKFPKLADTNPEIERMWAYKKMQRLMDTGKKVNDTDKYASEIVRLGEGYSIVSEYTSFLVLENDNEYKRWKIERRNALRIKKDRKSQERIRKALKKLKTTQSIPEKEEVEVVKNIQKPQSSPSKPHRAPVRRQNSRRSNSHSFDFSLPNLGGGGGGGAIDPLTALCAIIMAGFFFKSLKNNKKKTAQDND